jgi:peptidoglycan-associated lipoprotein
MVYEIEVEKDSFLVARNQISTINEENSKRFLEEVYLIPIVDESGEAAVIDFPEVQYALDKAELLIDENVNSEDSLDFLYATLLDNPNIVIELQAHTDCRGSDKYNKKLSQRRAQSCVDYLISKGIPKERMVPVGYGEDRPRMEGLECGAIDKLSTKEEQEAAHQKNRRTQFIVLSTDYSPDSEE